MTDIKQTKTAQIRSLNDALRQGRSPSGRIFMTQGVNARGQVFVQTVLGAVQTFGAFDKDNDPYGEHDFGALTVDGQKIFFKIDYYDRAMESGSPDPTDPSVTMRVLTIMLAEEY